MDASLVSDLHDALEEITRLTRDLKRVLGREHQALVTNKTDDLVTIVQEKQSVVRQLHEAEDHRRMMTRRLQRALGLPGGDVSLSDLSVQLGEKDANLLSSLKDRLLSAMKDVCAGNDRSAQLLRRAVYFNSHMLKLLTGRDSRTYGRDGAAQSAPLGLVDKEA